MKTENTLNISVLLSHLRETSRRGLWFKHCSCSCHCISPISAHVWCQPLLYRSILLFQQQPALHCLWSNCSTLSVFCTQPQATFKFYFISAGFHYLSFSSLFILQLKYRSIHRRRFKPGTKFCYALTSIDIHSQSVSQNLDQDFIKSTVQF